MTNLFFELFYFVFWFASMFVVVGYVESDVAEYRLSHYKLFAHFFSPAALFPLMSGLSGAVSPWFWLIIGMVIGTDVFSVMENYIHLSPVEHPHFFVLEVVLSISALVLSLSAILWFTALYLHHRHHHIHNKEIDDKDVDAAVQRYFSGKVAGDQTMAVAAGYAAVSSHRHKGV
jgi:hypothetical protein